MYGYELWIRQLLLFVSLDLGYKLQSTVTIDLLIMVESAKMMQLLVYLSQVTHHPGPSRYRRFLRPLVYSLSFIPPTHTTSKAEEDHWTGFIRLVPNGPSSWRHSALCTFLPHPYTRWTRLPLIYYLFTPKRSHAQDDHVSVYACSKRTEILLPKASKPCAQFYIRNIRSLGGVVEMIEFVS